MLPLGPNKSSGFRRVAALLVLVLILLVILFLFVDLNRSVPPNTLLGEIPQMTDATKDDFKSQPIQLPLVDSTTTDQSASRVIDVYKVQDIKDGIYKGDIVAFAALRSHTGGSVLGYAYFVSDASGTAIATDDSLVVDCSGLGSCNSGIQYGWPDFQSFFKNSIKQEVKEIPSEFHYNANVSTQSNHMLHVGEVYLYPDAYVLSGEQVDTTEGGFPVMRAQMSMISKNHHDIAQQYTYWIDIPGDLRVSVAPKTIPTSGADIPALSWLTGSTTVAGYHSYNSFVNVNIPDCFAGLRFEDIQSTWQQTGTSVDGKPVYEVDPRQYSNVYACLSARSTLDPERKQPQYSPTEITSIHPLFFWQGPYGDWYMYVRDDVALFDMLGHD